MAQIKRIGWKFFKVKKSTDTFVGCFKCDSADIYSKVNYCCNCSESYLKRIPTTFVFKSIVAGIVAPILTANMMLMDTTYDNGYELAIKIFLFSAPFLSTAWLLKLSDQYDKI